MKLMEQSEPHGPRKPSNKTITRKNKMNKNKSQKVKKGQQNVKNGLWSFLPLSEYFVVNLWNCLEFLLENKIVIF